MKYNIKKIASSLAPGFFMVGYVVGTGSVTTMIVAGARYSMSLSWALLLSCLFTAVLMIGISRLTIVSGKTLVNNFRNHVHPAVGIFMIFALMLTSVTSIIGVTAVATSIFQEWSRPFTSGDSGISPVASSLIMLGILYGLFWFGKYNSFLKFMSVIVGIMAVCFVFAMILVIPDFEQIASGFIPQIPSTGEPFIVIAGMVGTTMAGNCLVSRSTVVKEKGWQITDLKIERRDSIFAMILTFIISASIIAVAAGTLHVRGISVENAVEMIYTLEPLAGRFAITVFTIGILCAAISSLFPNMIILPWLLNDYNFSETSLKTPLYRFLVLIITSSGLIVPLFGGKPVIIMIASQAVSPLIMPILVGMLFYLLNNKKVTGGYKPGWFLNSAIVLTFIFSLFMSFVGFQGLFSVVNN